MQELVNKFKELIEFRDNAIESKFGKTRHDAFNYPENRFWYADKISPIDKEIIEVANNILTTFDSKISPLKTIGDVYINDTLKNIYLAEINKQSDEEIIK